MYTNYMSVYAVQFTQGILIMFVTKEELVRVKEWVQSSTGNGFAAFKYLSQFATDDSRIVFIDVDSVKRDKVNENKIKINVFMAVTEEGFPIFKEIYKELKESILHPLCLNAFFMDKVVHQKEGKVPPFAFTMATIGYDVEANTKQYAQMLTEQYVGALAKAFQKGYSK